MDQKKHEDLQYVNNIKNRMGVIDSSLDKIMSIIERKSMPQGGQPPMKMVPQGSHSSLAPLPMDVIQE